MDMSQLASLLGKSGAMGGMTSNKALVEFKAGRMNYEGKRVTADKRRGTIKIVKDQQGLTQFQWIEAGSNNPFQNMMIFPGDAKFEKVKQSKDRVYMLEFIQSKNRHFYWIQEKGEEEDANRCRQLNNVINGKDPEAMEVSETPAPAKATENRPQVRAPSTSQPPNPGKQDYNELLSQFLNSENMGKMVGQLRGAQRSGPSLNSVISSESKNKVLEDEKACERLYEHCPEGQQDQNGLRDSLHSAQLKHILSSLENAIENGQGLILLTQMGIDPNNPGKYAEIVELFNSIAKGGS